MSQETALYDGADVLITKQRAVIGGKTFAMANISSVSMFTAPADTALARMLIGGGLLLAICTLGVSLIATVVGFIMLKNAEPTYVVMITSASAETRALESPDKQFIQDVVAALNEAIIHRG